MTLTIGIQAPGGPEALEVIHNPPRPEPGPGEVVLRQHAIGVNFIDIYHRRGLHALPAPGVPGVEGAGVVEAVGTGVEGIRVGDRVAYAGEPGGYASLRRLPAWRAVKLPESVAFDVAAASMLRGLTTYMLLNASYPVTGGTVLLVHAAAGGLGTLLTRWAKRLGATVIGTVSTEEKAALALANGADRVIPGRDADLVRRVSELTGGKGVDLVIDGIGGTTLSRSLRCVRPFGVVANIGWAAGMVPPIRIEELGQAALSKPSVMAYAADPHRYAAAARAVIEALEAGIASYIGGRYRLAEAAKAHATLETGGTTGSLVLIP